ncbi:ABC transporter permease [Pseudooceanicola sp.]|jgi:NitT/TauT family transport system permease protein|uniref:ABC transporter permease n=1 Tax=Pseudooceanicola sp. TaxID=1914328 RepID=UPI004059F4AB
MTTMETNPAAANSTEARRARLSRRRRAATMGRLRDFAIWLASAVVLLIVWQYLVVTLEVSPAVFPTPVAVWESLYVNIMDGTFLRDLWFTMKEVMIGFFGGASVGFLLALAISEFRPIRVLLYPYVIAFQSVPKTALAPMFLIWFGFGIESKVALVVSTVFFPVLVNTLAGLERTDPDQLDLLRAYCGKRARVFMRVKLPSALPSVFAGLELGVVLALIMAVVSEFLGAVGGLGYRIMIFNTNLDMAGQFAAIIVLSIVGYILHFIVRQIGERVVFWGRAKEGATKV